jgi:hypothetical protein
MLLTCALQDQHGGRLPTHIARRIFQQLAIALDFCARLGKCARTYTVVPPAHTQRLLLALS